MQYVQNVRLWLKHKFTSVLAIDQLYRQSATAPGCTTQLWDVRDLPLPVRRSSKPVSCTFLDKFFIPLRLQFSLKNSGISCRAPYPFDSHKFCVKIVSSSVSVWNICQLFSSHDNDVMFMAWIKMETAYLQRVFIPVFRYVKVIKIHQDFPELRLLMYCHLFMVQCIWPIYNFTWHKQQINNTKVLQMVS